MLDSTFVCSSQMYSANSNISMWDIRKIRVPFFRVFYSTTYTILLLFLLLLLAVTPGDHIYQTLNNTKLAGVFIVGGVYVITGLIAVFIFASRLYTNRIVLSAIPKSYIPIEDGEVTKNVRRMIVKNRQRSAIIAWESRPKDLRRKSLSHDESEPLMRSEPADQRASKRKIGLLPDNIIPISESSPPWGDIVHPGWSSPCTHDLPNLQFETVVAELPNLIEAKAVSLAPADSTFGLVSQYQDVLPPPPDPRAVAILQRPSKMGLREYLSHLDSLGLINPPTLSATFLAQYEYARFSTSALTEDEFRDLMAVFSEILTGMVELDLEALTALEPDEVSLASSQPSVRRKYPSNFRSAISGTYSPSVISLQSTHSIIRHSPAAS